uniref:Nucleotide exchange factor SIL1 n=2 Tax=Anopheles triannulatus TaxID=58253 RepID=A0A2M4ANS0_9DIPT
MPKMKPIYVLHLLAVLVIANATAPNDSAEKSKFVATKEWQEIPEGQGIPQGLHVRINLSTGKKEAKLLDDESAAETQATDAQRQGVTESSLSLVPGQEVEDHGSRQPAPAGSLGGMNLEAIKEALRDIPANDYKPEDATVSGRYKSYSQIKQELKDANVELQTDSEIMGALLGRFTKSVSNEQELDALFEDLRYLAHQIDNALEFIDRGGVEQIIWPSLNRTGEQHQRGRVQALTLLGTLAQNNPKAKVSLFERDASAKLLAALGRATVSEELSAALYAFGSLVRKFPFAQKQLLTPHGYSLLYDIWTKPVVELKVKVKALQLVADVVEDYLSVTNESGSSPEPVDAVTVEQYRSTRLTEGLEKTEFCKHAGQFFQAHRAALVADEHLTDETVRALRSCRTLCRPLWSECALFRHTLLVLRNNLDNRLSDDPDLVAYRTEIQLHIDDFLRDLYGNGKPKDEL